MKRFSIIKRSYIWLTIGAALLIWSWTIFFMNMRFSEEFTGWVKIKVDTKLDQIATEKIQSFLEEKKYKDTNVSLEAWDTTSTLSIKVNVETDEQVATLSKEVQQSLLDNKYISSKDQIIEQTVTGPSVGDYMQKSAKNALIVGLVLMAIYMMFSFAAIRNSVPPSILAGVTIITMIFDVSIPAWAYGFLMMVNHTVSINTVFIIAVLTNMWYSINDTIIVFDRIRENIQNKSGKSVLFGKLFDDSLWQTMRRSIGTVLSTFLVIVCMYIFGTGDIKTFAFTIGVWVLAGSYSSIFISAPLAYILMGKYKEEHKQMVNHQA